MMKLIFFFQYLSLRAASSCLSELRKSAKTMEVTPSIGKGMEVTQCRHVKVLFSHSILPADAEQCPLHNNHIYYK
jgi:hypothetical protein